MPVRPPLPAWLQRRLRVAARQLRVLLLALAVVGLTPLAAALDAAHDLVSLVAHEVVAQGAGCTPECPDDCEVAGCHGSIHHCACCQQGSRVLATAERLPFDTGERFALNAAAVRPPPWTLSKPDVPPPRA